MEAGMDRTTAGDAWPLHTAPESPLLLRAEEAARLLGLGRSTVFALLATGELPSVRVGRSVRVSRTALQHFIGARECPR